MGKNLTQVYFSARVYLNAIYKRQRESYTHMRKTHILMKKQNCKSNDSSYRLDNTGKVDLLRVVFADTYILNFFSPSYSPAFRS